MASQSFLTSLLSVIKGYCRNGNAEKADRVLAELEENFGSEVLSVAMCISTWSKSEGNEDRAIEKAESLLEKLVDKFQKGQVRSFHAPVDTWVLEDVARLWLRSRRPEAGDRIVALIETQKELHRFAPDYFAPTENLYVLAFDALTKTEVDADQKALALLNRFEHLAKEGALQPPTVRAYSSVICDLASSTNDKSLLKALELFETILQKIESGDSSGALSPMTVSLLFRTIFRSREKHAGEIALDILRRTVDVAKKQPSLITLNKTVFVNLLSGLSRRQLPDKAREAIEIMNDLAKEGYDTVPDAKAYTIVASSIASKKTPTTLQEAEDLQSKLMKLYEDGKLEADIRLWNSVLEVYKNVAHSREEASQLAYDLLMRLEEFGKSDDRLSPNLASYRSVCEALSKSKAPNSSAKSVALFCRAKELSQIGLISELDNSFYFAAISAHAKDKSDGGLDEASTLLEEMRNSEKQCLVPDYRTYNRILSAYAHSDQADKASRTAAILKQMEEDFAAGNESCQPSVHSYNSVGLLHSQGRRLLLSYCL